MYPLRQTPRPHPLIREGQLLHSSQYCCKQLWSLTLPPLPRTSDIEDIATTTVTNSACGTAPLNATAVALPAASASGATVNTNDNANATATAAVATNDSAFYSYEYKRTLLLLALAVDTITAI